MGTEVMGVDAVYAWPSAESMVLRVEEAAKKIYERDLITASNPEGILSARLEELGHRFTEPYHSASVLACDDIIDPRDTRLVLIRALRRLSRKLDLELPRPKRKHNLIPI